MYNKDVIQYAEGPYEEDSPYKGLDVDSTWKWSKCKDGYAMTGIKRGVGNVLHRLEYFECAKPKGSTGTKMCQEIDLNDIPQKSYDI